MQFCKSTVFNFMYCKDVACNLSVAALLPQPIAMTSVAVGVGEVAIGMMYKEFENHTVDGSLIRAMSLEKGKHIKITEGWEAQIW